MNVLKLHMKTRNEGAVHEVIEEQTEGSIKVSLWFKNATKGLCDVTLTCVDGAVLTEQYHDYGPFDKEFWRMQYTFEGENIQVILYNLTSNTGNTMPLPINGSECTLSTTGGNEHVYVTEFDTHKFKSFSYKISNYETVVGVATI